MQDNEGRCEPNCQCNSDLSDPKQIDRRTFLKTASVTAAGVSLGGVGAIAGPFEQQDVIDHFVPIDKKLKAVWVKALFAKGERSWYRGGDLATIGMPVGGVCAGQVYLTGDGRLTYWDIFNQNVNTGVGQVNYTVGRKPTEVAGRSDLTEAPAVDQGFAVQVKSGGETMVKSLDRRDFSGVRFCGEYPIGYVDYQDETFPVAVRLEAFSPFIPLNAADSALPATIMNYTVKNTSNSELEVSLGGWLENVICRHSGTRFSGRILRRNSVVGADGVNTLSCGVRLIPPAPGKVERAPIVFADFEGDNYGDWKVEGEAFGKGPARGTLPRQQAVSGFKGKGLINTFIDGDRPEGRLRSPEFTIERPFISFIIGGGSHKGMTCINLIVDSAIVRTATGVNNEYLEAHNWEVEEFIGKQGRIEIVDFESGGWGHINIDQIEFRDERLYSDGGELHLQSDYGTMALSVLGVDKDLSSVSLPEGEMPRGLFEAGAAKSKGTEEKGFEETLRGMVGKTTTIKPGEEATVTFVLSWCMPNMRRGNDIVGNYYTKFFNNAVEVARYVNSNFDRLSSETRLWHDSYYDSSLPWWLLDRLHSTAANLASTTCQWWRNGRFWAWEGCGCCRGTCGHVWNYEHTLARLFPELERSVREMQDFAAGVGFNAADGSIAFRGENYDRWAGDAQGGYVLKAYREHLISDNDDFLERNWVNIRKAMQFLIDQDANGDGLIEGQQHQTYDQDYYGANTMVGSLYLGALRAAEEMAREVGDTEFAETCRKIFESGKKLSVEKLFNGEYFIQEVDLEKYPQWQYGDGCLADHLFGQGWAHQVGLGYIYPEDKVRSALNAIWKYCWAPDVGQQNKVHEPYRWYAYPGEAGLFTCTWPKSKHLGENGTRYKNEIWTGIEYQVAGHMAWEGMVTEALAICRGIHERYHPAKHNPWNEIECGDHYARAMASWGVLIGLSGLEYNGPAGIMGIAPRMSPDDFKCVFTAAAGWGNVVQERQSGKQINRIELKWGELQLNTLKVTLGEKAEEFSYQIRLDERIIKNKILVEDDKLIINFDQPLTLKEGQVLEAVFSY